MPIFFSRKVFCSQSDDIVRNLAVIQEKNDVYQYISINEEFLKKIIKMREKIDGNIDKLSTLTAVEKAFMAAICMFCMPLILLQQLLIQMQLDELKKRF